MKKSGLFFVALSFSVLSHATDTPNPEPGEADEVFVSRGGVSITYREFEAGIAHIPEEERPTFLRDARRLERVLANLLTQKQLAQEAREAGIDQDPLIQDRMKLASTRLLAEIWLEQYVDNRPDGDYEAMAREQYLLNPEQFQTEESIDVSHILISTDERTDSEALEIANGLLDDLASDPTAWDALVKQYSEDPSASANNGTFFSVKKGDMVRPFELAAFSLSPGEISEPVLTQYGYHLIRLEKINEPQEQAFEEVKEDLIEKQKAIHRRRARTDYLNKIGEPATELPTENLFKMLTRYFDEDELNMPDKE